jgi:hypothetical protein
MRGVERRDGAKSNDPRLSGAERTLAIGCVCAVRRSTAAIFGRRPQRDRSWCRCWRYSPGPLGSWLRARRSRTPLFRSASGSPHDGAPHRTECIPGYVLFILCQQLYTSDGPRGFRVPRGESFPSNCLAMSPSCACKGCGSTKGKPSALWLQRESRNELVPPRLILACRT